MLACKKKRSSATCYEIFFGTEVIMVHMMLNPPCMMPGHKHRECCKSEKPPVRCCFLEDKVVIALMCKLKQIDVNPRSNCPSSQKHDPPWLAAQANGQSDLSRSKCDTPKRSAWRVTKEAFDFWMVANHLLRSIAVPDGIGFVRVTDSITYVNFIAREHWRWGSKNAWVKPNFFVRWCIGRK